MSAIRFETSTDGRVMVRTGVPWVAGVGETVGAALVDAVHALTKEVEATRADVARLANELARLRGGAP